MDSGGSGFFGGTDAHTFQQLREILHVFLKVLLSFCDRPIQQKALALPCPAARTGTDIPWKTVISMAAATADARLAEWEEQYLPAYAVQSFGRGAAKNAAKLS